VPRPLAAAAIAIGFNILRSLCGPQWQPQDVQFSFAAPRALAPFRKVFSLTPRFDQERSAIAFPARWLANPPPGRRGHDLPAAARRGAVRARVPAAAQHYDSDGPDRRDRGLFGE
jgi:hypothetical protein